MGLDTSHDCWHGPYSSFNRFRREVAKAVGIDLEQMEGFISRFAAPTGDPIAWSSLAPDPIHLFLNHSDCDGSIEAKDCGPIADRLEAIVPTLEKQDAEKRLPAFLSHAESARQFARGLRLAAERGENVEFH